MKYIIADRMKAAQAGLSIRGCLRNDEHIIFDEKDEAEELKKKGRVLKEKMELDRKKGIAQ